MPVVRDGDEPLTFAPELAQGLLSSERLVRRQHDLLITGESGVGKEVVARWLHAVSVGEAITAAPLLEGVRRA